MTDPAVSMIKTPTVQFACKTILAPMVRVGTLPSRLLALRYGADLVYTEEIIDFKMVGRRSLALIQCMIIHCPQLRCRRVVNHVLDTIDFIGPDDTVTFRTCAEERDRVVFQMGTADPERACRVAELVSNDVAAIDVNMGCPKDFSIKGGMGAALLTQPGKVRDILTALVRALPHKHITCKIRLLPTYEESAALVKLIESTGVSAVAIHGRLREQRPREPVTSEQCDFIKRLASEVAIPVISNGGSLDIKVHADIAEFGGKTGTSSVMVARAAEWNMSIFRKDGLLPINTVIPDYLKLAVDTENEFGNSKFCVMAMSHEELATDFAHKIGATNNLREMCALWGLEDYHDDAIRRRTEKAEALKAAEDVEFGAKRAKKDDSVVEAPIRYVWRDFAKTSPKEHLHRYCSMMGLPAPEFTVTERTLGTRVYFARCKMDGLEFASLNPEPGKKHAEHATSMVALKHYNLFGPTVASLKVTSAG